MSPRDRGGGGQGEEAELNLVHFMNMVVVIIPMLLLSVVFLKAGVINITSPKLSTGPPSEKKPKKKKKPLNLTVAIGDKGIRIGATGAILPPQEGCPKPGPTLCLQGDKEASFVEGRIKEARQLFKKGGKSASRKAHNKLKEAASAYDWMGLYNQLRKIKKKYPDETVVKISANPNIPYAFIVRAMDVSRYKLPEDSYDNRQKFWSAKPQTKRKGNKKIPKRLFSDPILSIAK